jgi:hypothetical protein
MIVIIHSDVCERLHLFDHRDTVAKGLHVAVQHDSLQF